VVVIGLVTLLRDCTRRLECVWSRATKSTLIIPESVSGLYQSVFTCEKKIYTGHCDESALWLCLQARVYWSRDSCEYLRAFLEAFWWRYWSLRNVDRCCRFRTFGVNLGNQFCSWKNEPVLTSPPARERINVLAGEGCLFMTIVDYETKNCRHVIKNQLSTTKWLGTRWQKN
jgi:hypothetical protein